MNIEDLRFSTPMAAAERGLGEALDDFEAGLARSFADGSRLVRLLIQLLTMLREALARFATTLPADPALAAVAAVPAADMARVADVERPMRARRVRVAPARVAARDVATVVVAILTLPGWAWALDRFCVGWVAVARVRFSKSSCYAR
jgi:hypothetical protein